MKKVMIFGRTAKLGEWVGFKSDVEQSGKIVAIRPTKAIGGGFELVLENPNGFHGDYIGGSRRTVVDATDCW